MKQEEHVLDELTLKRAIEFAVQTEEIGAKVYTKLADKFANDKELNEIFSVLARDEEAHRRRFELILEKVPEENQGVGEERWQYLRAMSISEFFGGKKGLANAASDVKDREDALTWALGLEKATLQYYEAMRDVLGDKEALDQIIQAEKSHVMTVMKYLFTEAKVRGVPESVDAEDFK